MRTLFEHSYTRATNRIDAERRAEKRKEAAQAAQAAKAAPTALATALDQNAGKGEEDKRGEKMALIKPGAPAADVPTKYVLAPGDTVQIQPSAITSGSLPERFSLCEAAVVDASDMPSFLQV